MYLGIWQCLQGNMILRMPHMNNDWNTNSSKDEYNIMLAERQQICCDLISVYVLTTFLLTVHNTCEYVNIECVCASLDTVSWLSLLDTYLCNIHSKSEIAKYIFGKLSIQQSALTWASYRIIEPTLLDNNVSNTRYWLGICVVNMI